MRRRDRFAIILCTPADRHEDHELRGAFGEGMSSMTEVVAPAIAAACSFNEIKTECDVSAS